MKIYNIKCLCPKYTDNKHAWKGHTDILIQIIIVSVAILNTFFYEYAQ